MTIKKTKVLHHLIKIAKSYVKLNMIKCEKRIINKSLSILSDSYEIADLFEPFFIETYDKYVTFWSDGMQK